MLMSINTGQRRLKYDMFFLSLQRKANTMMMLTNEHEPDYE